MKCPSAAAIAMTLAVAASATTARAETKADPARWDTVATSPPRAPPAPFVLPDLAHDRWDLQLDVFYGRLSTTGGLARTSVPVGLARLSMEANVIVPRRFFLGFELPLGASLPPDGGLAPGEVARPSGTRHFAGNVEAHLRGVFPLPTWLEIGFLLGVVAPTATYDRDYRPDRSASAAIGSLDPTSYAEFLPARVVLRPAGDLRVRRGPLIFQGRHGLDFLIDNQGVQKATIAGRLLGHIGYLVSPTLEVSLEAQQMYFFTSEDKVTTGTPAAQIFGEAYRIQDGHRSFLTFGPGLRATTTNFDYGVAFVTNIADPLSPVVDRVLGLRFSIIGHIPKHALSARESR